jgi:TetR/AcrR family transcriptional repressor of nem operon
VAEALVSALEMWKRQIKAAASGGAPVTYESVVGDYLSEAHRKHPGTGCPVSALAGDIARSDKQTRALVTGKIRDNIELIANLFEIPASRTSARKAKDKRTRASQQRAQF